jgi:hypothetical protein
MIAACQSVIAFGTPCAETRPSRLQPVEFVPATCEPGEACALVIPMCRVCARALPLFLAGELRVAASLAGAP